MEDINQNRPEEVHPPPEGKPVAEHSFDELAKGLADGSVSRRQALRWIGGALVGGLLASIPGAAAFAQQPSTFCGSGYCYPPGVCDKGGGRPRCVCPTGFTLSNGRCVCANTCSGGKILNESTCTCGCPTGQTDCGGTCVNLTSDTRNCGSCGNACGTTADDCINGQCTCGGGPRCTGGATCQGGSCSGESGEFCYDRNCAAGEECCAGYICYNSDTHYCCAGPYYFYGIQYPSEVCDLSYQHCCNGVCVDSGTPCPQPI